MPNNEPILENKGFYPWKLWHIKLCQIWLKNVRNLYIVRDHYKQIIYTNWEDLHFYEPNLCPKYIKYVVSISGLYIKARYFLEGHYIRHFFLMSAWFEDSKILRRYNQNDKL